VTNDIEQRDARISLRATARQRHVIEQAAEACGKSLTAFLLDAGYTEAQRTLADRRLFLLDDERWEQFVAALDRPVSDKPRLRELLRTPGVLD
jgi:uncharacterized protein (DUF1778 family)